MGNIDDKTISLLLEKIDSLKAGLSALEDEVKALLAAEEPASVVEEVAQVVEEPSPVPEPVEGPVAEPVEPVEEPVVEEAAPAPEPIDITISDFEMPVPPVVEPLADDLPAEEGTPEEEPVADDILDDIPEIISVTEPSVPAPVVGEPVEPVEVPAEAKKSILDSAKADTAVMDVMAEKQAWRTDRPGMPVKNIISAISLNDRVLLINVLFREDPMLFQDTIAKFNAMGSLKEALDYISENYPEWDMNSEPVYRLMMAVRRKLN